MSFDNMRDRPVQKNYGLRSDWSSEEKRFKDGLPEFLAIVKNNCIVSGNPIFEFNSEINSSAEVVSNKEVLKEPEKIKIIPQEQANCSVESINVRETNIGLSASQPPQPAQQEFKLNDSLDDPFDSIVESNKPSNYAKTSDDPFDFVAEPPKKQAATPSVPAAKVSAVSDDDLFGEPVARTSSTAAPAANPIVPQPAPAVTKQLSVTAPAAESAQPAKPSVTMVIEPSSSAMPAKIALYDPVNDPEGAALADSYIQKKAEKAAKAETQRMAGKVDGFDYDAFQEVIETANEMLAGLPEFDLDSLLNSLGEYSVSLDLDYLRENPHILSDRLLEIQAKRDSLFVATLRLTPLIATMKSAYNYYENVGVTCSTESSREKRLAQMMKSIPQFLIRYAHVERTQAAVDQTFQHLEGQYECISRLITAYQIKNKVGEISRGAMPYAPTEEVPFGPPYRDRATGAVTPAPQPAPVRVEAAKEPAKPTGKAPVISADDDFVNRSMSQPLSGKKFESLESFTSGVKPARKTTSQPSATGEVEW